MHLEPTWRDVELRVEQGEAQWPARASNGAPQKTPLSFPWAVADPHTYQKCAGRKAAGPNRRPLLWCKHPPAGPGHRQVCGGGGAFLACSQVLVFEAAAVGFKARPQPGPRVVYKDNKGSLQGTRPEARKPSPLHQHSQCHLGVNLFHAKQNFIGVWRQQDV